MCGWSKTYLGGKWERKDVIDISEEVRICLTLVAIVVTLLIKLSTQEVSIDID